MKRLNKFQIKDCLGNRFATFSISEKYLDDFINAIDIPFMPVAVKVPQRYFWELMMQYKTEKQWRNMVARCNSCGHGIDCYYYIQYL